MSTVQWCWLKTNELMSKVSSHVTHLSLQHHTRVNTHTHTLSCRAQQCSRSECTTAKTAFFHTGINTEAYRHLTARHKQSLYLSLFWGQEEFTNKESGLLVSVALGRRTKKASETISGDRDEQFQLYLLVFGISTADVLWNAAVDTEIIFLNKNLQ